jgi:predicted RNase H-like HicB family nuclease
VFRSVPDAELYIAKGSFYFMNRTLVVTAVVHREDKWFVADCPELGTVSQGRTFEEAVQNLQEATDLYIEEFGAPANIPARSVITTFETTYPVYA